EAMSLAAAKATIEKMRREDVIGHLARQGAKLFEGVGAIAAELDMPWVSCAGHPARAIVKLSVPEGVRGVTALEMKTLVQQEMVARGVLWSGFHNLSYAHTDADVAQVLDAYRETLPILREAVRAGDVKSRLRGKVLEGVFRKIENVHVKKRS